MTEWTGPLGYVVSDAPARIDLEFVHHWLSTESYWALGRPRQVTEAALAASVNLSLLDPSDTQVGFCRWVTDRATFAWLCDVFVAGDHQGKGAGTFLVGTAVEHESVRGLRLFLGTKDAHGLYRKFGFTDLAAPERYMEVRPGPLPG
jgi:GNAT superfamily N-acetyltransferase